ncbi:MAG: hypothetical protein ACK4YP_03940 [Myxococcota bacterium]
MRALFPLVVLLAACPAPEKPAPNEPPAKARFGAASPAARGEALQVALGMGPVYAVLAQLQADADARSVDENNAPSGCPAMATLDEDPLTVEYTADTCIGPSGTTWGGRLHAVNPLTWEDTQEGHGGGAVALTFDGFSLGDGVFSQTFEGTFAQTDLREGIDAVATYDLTSKLGGAEWYIGGSADLTWEGSVQRVVCRDGMNGAVGGLGGFDIACDVLGFGQTGGEGFVELTGEDTLRVEMTPDPDGCLPATVDGQPVEPICFDGSGTPQEPVLDDRLFLGGGTGCMGDELFVFDTETIVGEVARVEIDVAPADRDAFEHHVLPFSDASSDEEWDVWMLQVEQGGYVSGVSTGLTCADQDSVHIVAFAYDADGAVIGCKDLGVSGSIGPIDVTACPVL